MTDSATYLKIPSQILDPVVMRAGGKFDRFFDIYFHFPAKPLTLAA